MRDGVLMLRKVISFCLFCVLVFLFPFSCEAKDGLVDLNFQFTTVENVSVTFFVSADGKANTQYTVSVKKAESMVIKTYIEQRIMGIFWRRVDIGISNNEWTDRVGKRFNIGSHAAYLSESGMYRATIEVYIGSDKIIKTAEHQYDKDIFIGDANGDGKITAFDARMVLRCSAGIQQYSAAQKARFDVNSDGKITAADARLLLRISAFM